VFGKEDTSCSRGPHVSAGKSQPQKKVEGCAERISLTYQKKRKQKQIGERGHLEKRGKNIAGGRALSVLKPRRPPKLTIAGKKGRNDENSPRGERETLAKGKKHQQRKDSCKTRKKNHSLIGGRKTLAIRRERKIYHSPVSSSRGGDLLSSSRSTFAAKNGGNSFPNRYWGGTSFGGDIL